jgi:MFS family permease
MAAILVAVEIPSNLALKVLRPQYWITGNMILWSICTVGLGLCKTGKQLMAVRFLLGLFEGGLFPGLNFIFSLYYTREELGKRVAIFFAGATREWLL